MKFINNRSRKLLLSKQNKHNISASKRTSFAKKIKIPYFNLKLRNEINFFLFRFKRLAYSNKLKYIRKLFFFYFLKYTLSLFQTKVDILALKQTIKIVFTVNNKKYFKVISLNSFSLEKNFKEKNKLSVITRINFEL